MEMGDDMSGNGHMVRGAWLREFASFMMGVSFVDAWLSGHALVAALLLAAWVTYLASGMGLFAVSR